MSDAETRRYFRPDAALFVGPLPAPARHAHHAIQGSIALDGALEVRVRDESATAPEGALIAPDVPHAVAADGLVAHFYIGPESTIGARLVRAFAGRPRIELGPDAVAIARHAVAEALADERRFPVCLDTLFEVALREAPPAEAVDERVRDVLRTLRRAPDTPLEALACEARLSPDRLRHLIVEQTSLPLRRHRRWAKLVRALEALRESGSVTEASADSGFADTAHLSRTFRDAFTFPPSEFVRDSRFVQARRERSG